MQDEPRVNRMWKVWNAKLVRFAVVTTPGVPERDEHGQPVVPLRPGRRNWEGNGSDAQRMANRLNLDHLDVLPCTGHWIAVENGS